MAVEAMKNDRTIQKAIGIPEKETVYSIIALGFPNEMYKRQAGRKKPVIRFFQK
jgi:hypothetical protein